MNRNIYKSSILLLCSVLIPLTHISAQSNWNIVKGSDIGGNCFQLTKNKTHQKGAIWNKEMIDLNKPFKLYFNFNFGNSNSGADGIAIVFQKSPDSLNAIGEDGANIGYASSGTPVLSPSYDIEFDTFDDGAWLYNDIADDHCAINLNGSTNNVLFWPVPLLPNGGNVEDNVYHQIEIDWHPATITMDIYFDCKLLMSPVYDIKNWAFNGDNKVYYGVTSGTGSADNAQYYCELFHEAGNDMTFCPGAPVTLQGNTNFTTYSWSPSLGLSCTSCANPIADPTVSTQYIFTGSIGCLTVSDTMNLNTSCDPLPIELVSFSANCFKEKVVLNWATESEINNDFFSIERSPDGNHFEEIGTVDASGNSSSLKKYSFSDLSPLNGDVFYRLKQVDFDATSTYSKAEQVSCFSDLGIFIYPNPVSSATTIQIQSPEKSTAECIIINSSGSIVYKKEVSLVEGNNNLYLDKQHFIAGIYDVSVIGKNKVVHSLLVAQ